MKTVLNHNILVNHDSMDYEQLKGFMNLMSQNQKLLVKQLL